MQMLLKRLCDGAGKPCAVSPNARLQKRAEVGSIVDPAMAPARVLAVGSIAFLSFWNTYSESDRVCCDYCVFRD